MKTLVTIKSGSQESQWQRRIKFISAFCFISSIAPDLLRKKKLEQTFEKNA